MTFWLLLIFSVLADSTLLYANFKNSAPKKCPIALNLVSKDVVTTEGLKVQALNKGTCGFLTISRQEHDGSWTRIWNHEEQQAFLRSGLGKEKVKWERGSMFVMDKLSMETKKQSIDSIEVNIPGEILVKGSLTNDQQVAARYSMSITKLAKGQVQLKILLKGPSINRVFFSLPSSAEEIAIGFGAQTQFNMKGRKLPILSHEQGHGRGRQPLTALGRAIIAGESMGRWWTSYASIPIYMNQFGYSYLVEEKDYMEFDLTQPEFNEIKIFGKKLTLRIDKKSTPKMLIEAITSFTGRQPKLPTWTQKGAILALQGGQEELEQRITEIIEYKLPVSAIWVQDWVGVRSGFFWERMHWNWTLDRERYPNWEKIIALCKQHGIRLLTYINPRLSQDSGDRADINLFEEAKRGGYFITQEDGKLLNLDNGGINASIIDFSHSDAFDWYQNIAKKNILDQGASGWMADFGESVPFHANTGWDGSGAAKHHKYIEAWGEYNYKTSQLSETPDDILFFMRGAYTQSPKSIPLFWLGDQLTSWDRHDGMASTIPMLLNSGVVGMAVNHSDVGGVVGIPIPGLWVKRDEELFLRWFEMNTFTPILRTHLGANPKMNHQYFSSKKTLDFVKKFSSLYAALAPYRASLLKEASLRGIPVVRHPFLVDPDPQLLTQSDVFMLGDDVFVAPVIQTGQTHRHVTLPNGKWTHLWTDAIVPAGPTSYQAPIGKPAVFIRQDSHAHSLLIEWKKTNQPR